MLGIALESRLLFPFFVRNEIATTAQESRIWRDVEARIDTEPVHTKSLLLIFLFWPALAWATSTPARPPLAVVSNEATQEQLDLAAKQGRAARAALDWLLRAAPIAREMDAGPYHVACLVSAPEGYYLPNDGGGLRWIGARGNAHLRVIVRDGADGREIPLLPVRATIVDATGHQVAAVPLPYGWYPLLNGYAETVLLPGNGRYTVRVEIDPPQFHRHDPYNGDRFTQPTVAEFDDLTIQPGKLGSSLSARESGQLGLARSQGDAFFATVKGMFAQANDGVVKPAGDYRVVCAVEYSEAWWFYREGKFDYKYEEELSAKHNAHVEIAPVDARTGRFLPAPNVTAALVEEDNGQSLGEAGEHFMWHPWLYHYGDNWRVPHGGNYRITASFDPPAYRRYGRNAGRRFAHPVEVSFEHIKIKTGEK